MPRSIHTNFVLLGYLGGTVEIRRLREDTAGREGMESKLRELQNWGWSIDMLAI